MSEIREQLKRKWEKWKKKKNLFIN